MTSYVQSTFAGGEVSKSFQGRIDRTDYRTFMNTCLNVIPIESGAALPRPGTRHLATTRGGAEGKLIALAFEERQPYAMEFTNGYLRFFAGDRLVKTNTTFTVTAISAASPAVVTTSLVHIWNTGETVMFADLVGCEVLQNRQFKITVTATDKFSIVDAVTGVAINGAAIGTFVSGRAERVREVVTPYTGDLWSTVRSVQAEKTAVLLNGTQPQILTVSSPPGPTSSGMFTLAASDFLDGPYLDPIRGSLATPSSLVGNITLTLSFQPYSAAVSYSVGDYVTSGGIGYISITAANVNHAPPNATHWRVVNGGDPINGGTGFTTADIGRLVRLFSEPPLWDATVTYTTETVAYSDGNLGFGYWRGDGAVAAGVQPGSTVDWLPVTAGARWTWGRITGVSAAGVNAPNTYLGNMSLSGGLASAFDGNTSKSLASASAGAASTTTYQAWAPKHYGVGEIVQYSKVVYQKLTGDTFYDGVPPPSVPVGGIWSAIGTTSDMTVEGYVGGHFNVAAAVHAVTVFPTIDIGFHIGVACILNLRAKNSLPTSGADGVLLGSTGQISNAFGPVTIGSNDTTTAYSNVWIEIQSAYFQPLGDDGSHSYTGYVGIAQVVIYTPNVANGSVVTVQIAGDPLLYTSAIRTWRLGLYGGPNGWPKCGTFHEGRLWLSGVIGNRADSSKAGDKFNFAPTAPSGAVAADNGISVVFSGPDVNQVRSMVPDQQGIICFTQGGEWLIAPPAPGGLSPTNVSGRRVTKIGAANIEPRRTEHTIAFVQKHQRKIMEYFADVYSGKLSAPNLTMKAKHLTVGGIAEIAYQQELAPIIWYRTEDGALRGITYKREKLATQLEPDICGAHRHALGSGRIVESMCVGPSPDGNLESLTLITNDPNTNVRHVEVMTELLDEGFILANTWMLDNAIHPTSCALAAVSASLPYGGLTLNGLWAHNDLEVTAFIAGLDCGEFTVEAGSITVPFGDGISYGPGSGLFTYDFVNSITAGIDASVIPMCVGFAYTQQGQIVRAAQQIESGTRAGPGLMKERRTHYAGALLYGAINGTISFGTEFTAANLHPAKLNSPGGIKYTVLQPWSGVYRQPVQSKSDFDSMLCWQVERPVPWMVIALGPFAQTQDT